MGAPCYFLYERVTCLVCNDCTKPKLNAQNSKDELCKHRNSFYKCIGFYKFNNVIADLALRHFDKAVWRAHQYHRT